MSDSTPAAVAATPTPTTDPVTLRLTELKVDPAIIEKIRGELGASSVEDLAGLTEADLVGAGMKRLPARGLVKALGTAPVVATATAAVDPTAELPEGTQPSQAQVTGFASQMGIDPTMFWLFMSGQGGEADLSGIMPIPTIVGGYNPKIRSMFLMIMGQVERRLGVPIVVIDQDGSVNKPLTIEYIEGLEEGREPAENNIYFDTAGVPHEVIRVGVDAQSVYDADPLEPTKSLQKNGMGTGRVNWSKVSLEVRQVAFYAATQTHEIDPANDGHMSWMRDHMKEGVSRLVFHGQAPRAISAFNEAARTGSLPTLRVMLSRSARRPEFMPRRRRSSPRDLSGIGTDDASDSVYPNR